MPSGNKGEWSEIYVFLKLLADGKIYAADENFEKIPTLFFPVLKILRKEVAQNRDYILNGNIKVVNSKTGELISEVPISSFVEYSKRLYENLKIAKGSSFDFEDIGEFLNLINCYTLKAPSSDKSDINIVIHDSRTGATPELGFSIKSMIGGDSTLFNAGKTTNFIYRVTGDNVSNLSLEEINSITNKPAITNKVKEIFQRGYGLEFCGIQSKNLRLNLEMISSDLPTILAHLLLYRYSKASSPKLLKLLEILKEKNPLGFDLSCGHPFYENRLKGFLTSTALGMTPSKVWDGIFDATGGIIIARSDGELICYHIYSINKFQDYLLKNTKLEQASTTKYEFGDLYEENGNQYMKLNLQVRFI